MATRRVISETEAERLADARVHRALARDRRYLHAEDAAAQAAAEAAIERAVWASIEREYIVN